jgi:hypothetical protein
VTPYSVRTTQRREVYSEKRIGRNRLNRTGLSIPFPTLPQRVCTDESASHLKIFIPKIEKAELDLLVSELKDQYIGIAFDGTSRLGEAINVTARWCSADFEIVMRFEDAVKTQLPQYLAAAANAPSFDKGSVADYSDAILSWWRDNGTAFPAWALRRRLITDSLRPVCYVFRSLGTPRIGGTQCVSRNTCNICCGQF